MVEGDEEIGVGGEEIRVGDEEEKTKERNEQTFLFYFYFLKFYPSAILRFWSWSLLFSHSSSLLTHNSAFANSPFATCVFIYHQNVYVIEGTNYKRLTTYKDDFEKEKKIIGTNYKNT